MKIIKQLAPRRLATAILALGSGTGNGLTRLDQKQVSANVPADQHLARESSVTRTTITVETERVLVVSQVRAVEKTSPSQTVNLKPFQTGG
jgi:hypothetical protein